MGDRRNVRSPLALITVGLNLDFGTDRIRVILEIRGVFENVLLIHVLDALHLDLGVFRSRCGSELLRPLLLGDVAAASARARLVHRLLSPAARAHSRYFGKVVKARAA